jgi:hypothetical protein
MENMKSLADQIREQLVKPAVKKETAAAAKPAGKTKPRETVPDILTAILAYDNSANKSMVHVRFDEKTVRTMNRFKMATGVDVTRLVAYSVRHLFETCPELNSIIKQFIQNTDL